MSVLEEVLEWVPRVIKLIPVFKDLWGAVKAGDNNQVLATQLEMQRQIREQQAREEFQLPRLYDDLDEDEVTKG